MWYQKVILNSLGESHVTDYLNKLNDNGIPPEYIKVTNITEKYTRIFYFSNKEIN